MFGSVRARRLNTCGRLSWGYGGVMVLFVSCQLDLLLVVENGDDIVRSTGELGKLAPGSDEGVKRVRLGFLHFSRAEGDFRGCIFLNFGDL
jgi:hypothetical protein